MAAPRLDFRRWISRIPEHVEPLGDLCLDDRLGGFSAKGTSLAVHYKERSLGRALCETVTWLDADAVNSRFKRLLADPFEDGRFNLLPVSKSDPDRSRSEMLDILFQLRHAIVHNVGVLTPSDAARLRVLRRGPTSPGVLELTNGDVWYAKLFLDDLATWLHERVKHRLSTLLTTLHASDPTLFDPAERGAELVRTLGGPVALCGQAYA